MGLDSNTDGQAEKYLVASANVLEVNCISPKNQTTPEKTLSNPFYGKGFCENNQYKVAVERCEGGYKSSELAIEIFGGLSKILETNTSAIRHWSTSSQKHIGQSTESCTTRKALIAAVVAAEKLADRQEDIAKGIKENVVEKMTTFKTQNYGKSMLQVKIIKDIEKEFKKTQRAWSDVLESLNKAKQQYHDSKRKLKLAENQEKVKCSDVGSTTEEQEAVKTAVQICRKETDRYQKKYQKSVDEMEKAQPTYEAQMFKTLARTDEFERQRLNHLNSMIVALQQATSLDKDKRHSEMATAFTQAINIHKIEDDIEFFNNNYGKGTTTKWPVFEDLN